MPVRMQFLAAARRIIFLGADGINGRMAHGCSAVSGHSDEGSLFHGVDASVSSSDDYGRSRTLALQLCQDFPDLDGLAYRSRHSASGRRISFSFMARYSMQVPILQPGVASRIRVSDVASKPTERH